MEDNTTRGHNWKLKKKHCRTDTRFHFFSQRTVNRWNNLSQKDIDATTLNSFKSRLERRRNQEMDFFKDFKVLMAARSVRVRRIEDHIWNRICQVQPHPVSYPVSYSFFRTKPASRLQQSFKVFTDCLAVHKCIVERSSSTYMLWLWDWKTY